MDPYRTEAKPTQAVPCASCRAVPYRGRWLAAAEARKRGINTVSTRSVSTLDGRRSGKKPRAVTLCPACHQLQERNALGVVELRGPAWREHSPQVQNTLKRVEKIARSRNDQERILWVQEDASGASKYYVSLPELARRMGRELEKTFHGLASYRHSTEEPFLRVRVWPTDEPAGGAPEAPVRRRRIEVKASSTRPHRSRAFRRRSAA